MGDRLTYERFLWFHGRVKAGRYPNARHLAEHYEISRRTAQRVIGFMQDRLKAPLAYDKPRNGYFYTQEGYELPPQWISEEDVIALALAVRLASSVPDTGVKSQLCKIFDTIFISKGGPPKLCHESICEKISVKNIEYSKVDERFFHEIVNALFLEKPVSIAYYSPHSRKKSERTILPLHLMHYMGSWHIIAYCSQKKELRDFALSRIKAISMSAEKITLPENLPSIKEYTRKTFGIMQGDEAREICLKFAPSVARWVSEQIWHPEQKVSSEKDGGLVLIFPVADFREVKRRILSFGAEVRVVWPEDLARALKEEIERMGKIYR
jgi:predicted DNA-binding transcriptional regulator YafY